MNKNLLALAVGAGSAVAAASASACDCYRLVATPPPAPRTEVRSGDDSGTNGRAWDTRPLVKDGPATYYSGNPGAEAYGAWGEEDQVVYVQVGQVAVSISPWEKFTLDGMQTFETARQQWLAENGYAGGVRTIRRVARAEAPAAHPVATTALPQPRATIQIPEGVRRKPGYHVDAGKAEGALRLAALKAGDEPVRISLPMTATAESRAMAGAGNGYLAKPPAAKKIEVADAKSK